MDRRLWLCLLALLPAAALALEPSPLHPLFDFEQGVSGWWANPWGGGKAFAEPAAEGRFGLQGLQARYVDVVKGANVISPDFPADAPWRNADYDTLVLWVKGDGSAAHANLILEATVGGEVLTFSRAVPLDRREWRRLAVRFDTLWNRQDQRFSLRTFRRLYLGCTGTHTVLLDGIALQRGVAIAVHAGFHHQLLNFDLAAHQRSQPLGQRADVDAVCTARVHHRRHFDDRVVRQVADAAIVADVDCKLILIQVAQHGADDRHGPLTGRLDG